jgi:hypothetical protein
MKIKVTEEALRRAIQRLIGIDLIIDTVDEARKALNLILEKTESSRLPDFKELKDIKLTQKVEHSSTAMDHQIVYVIEFILSDESYLSMEIALIQELQRIFRQRA